MTPCGTASAWAAGEVAACVPTYAWGSLRERSLVGRGTGTEIWRAELHGQAVALKAVRRTLRGAGRLAAAAELRREVRAHVALRHPHVVQLLGVSRAPGDAAPALVLELAARGRLRCGAYGRARLGDAARVGEKVAAALAGAHAQGWMHRDVKPSQVLLCDGGVPKLGDWGLAARVEEAVTGETGTWEFVSFGGGLLGCVGGRGL